MKTLRKGTDRGQTHLPWLDGHHTFSFGDYYDPKHMGFGVLRVINDDVIKPGGGFPTHPHRDMEILTYVLDGALEHRDSLGNGSVIRAGEVQYMSAGSGIRHSEFNASKDTPVHLLQIWIEPKIKGTPPRYRQVDVDPALKRDRFHAIVGATGGEDVIQLHQDVAVHAALLSAGTTLEQTLAPGRRAWLHVARGRVDIDGERLEAGDALGLEREDRLRIQAVEEAELLLFDLP
ncbi:pirin family protein [Methylomagnum sp.]